MDYPRRQQAEFERWTQAAGQLFQAEIEKAIVQGVTAALTSLSERLPQLLAEMQRAPASPRPSNDGPCLLRLSLEEVESETATPTVEISVNDTAERVQDALNHIAEHRPLPVAPDNQPVDETAESVNVYLRRGMEAEKLGDFEGALFSWTRAAHLKPDSATIQFARGRLLRRLGRSEEALAAAEKALQLDSRLAPAYHLRAVLLMRRGSNVEAIDDLTHFLELRPKEALAYYKRGLAYVNSADYERAIADFGRALRLRPKLLSARRQRALAYRLKGDYAFAVAEWTKILELRPNDAHASQERELAQRALEEHEQARKDFGKAMESAPQDVEIHARAGESRRTAKCDTDERREDKTDPTFLSLTCPNCGAPGRISWKHLDRLFRCRQCTRVYRVNREGHLKQIDPNPTASRRRRSFKRLALPVAIGLVVLLAIVFAQRWRNKPVLPPLPGDLQARGELWGKAWLNNDRSLLRRLTATTHDRQLHPWLTKNQPPTTNEQSAGPPHDSPPADIQLRIRKVKPNEAVVSVRITAASLKSPREFQLDWVERGDSWYFVPTLKR
jgi:tetratricopeptide (TPR) repeat protein